MMKAVIRAVLLLIVIAVLVAGVIAYGVAAKGLSTRVAPSAVEERIARIMRTLATPTAVRTRQNPVALSTAVFDESLEHVADHCAICHGNDGSGQTEIGRSFYPPAPDMRASRTQALTDGELFSIIEHGIRLTGMPAWGTATPAGERSTWALVHFIRRLPGVTPEEIARMEALNPKSPQEFREEEETRRFLAGDDQTPPPSSPTPHDGPHD